MNVQATLFGTIGGLGMFLFGMKLLSEGMQKSVELLFEKSLEAFEKNDATLAKEAFKIEDQIDQQKERFCANYIKRVCRGQCPSDAGIIFIDVVSNLERIGDHAVKLANWTYNQQTGTNEGAHSESTNEKANV